MSVKNIEIKNQNQVDETVGEHIGYDLGVKMVKDYYDQFGEGGAQFIGKNILQEVLSQPGCIGINVYKALNEKNEKTYVLVGLNKENQPIINYPVININGQLDQKEGIVADRSFGLGWFDTVIK